MDNKVLLIVVDGMRPDGAAQCGHPFFERLKGLSSHCLQAQTITRPITLPAHVSLFTGVSHETHGVYDNVWHSYPCELPGILETAHEAGKRTAAFVSWSPLCDICKPGLVDQLYYERGDIPGRPLQEAFAFERSFARKAVKALHDFAPDFMFFYYEMADVVGHSYGFMSKEYLQALYCAGECLETLYAQLPDGYQIIILADHGGHGTKHNDPTNWEDMTIPIYCIGQSFAPGKVLKQANLLDVAPTVNKLLGVPAPLHYQGTALI